MKDIKAMLLPFKDSALFTAWILVIILIAGLCWFLTGSVREDFLMASVNRAGISSIIREDSKPWLEKHIASRELPLNAARMGSWFTVRGNPGAKALVFTLFAHGNFLPCMAMVNQNGKVEEILPLSVHSQTMLNRIPEGVVHIYIHRIEEALK